jgi:hypothetical protein
LLVLPIQTISPEPIRSEAGPEGKIFVFALHDPSRPAEISFHLRPGAIGRMSGRAGLLGASSVDVSQFVYP